MTAVHPLCGHWVHAHEQDHGDVRVYVVATTALPPSRGRRHLNLRGDGSFDEQQPGPDDRPRATAGSYEFDGEWLTLRYRDPQRPVVAWRVSVRQAPAVLELVRQP